MCPVFFILFNLTVSANNYFGKRTVSTAKRTNVLDLRYDTYFPKNSVFPRVMINWSVVASLYGVEIVSCPLLFVV